MCLAFCTTPSLQKSCWGGGGRSRRRPPPRCSQQQEHEQRVDCHHIWTCPTILKDCCFKSPRRGDSAVEVKSPKLTSVQIFGKWTKCESGCVTLTSCGSYRNMHICVTLKDGVSTIIWSMSSKDRQGRQLVTRATSTVATPPMGPPSLKPPFPL